MPPMPSDSLTFERLEPPQPYPCPICHVPTHSLKCMTFARWLVCVITKFWVSEDTYCACPACMRRILRRQLLLNIPTANIAWPALVLIYLPRYAATYEDGHSRVLTEPPTAARRISDPIGLFIVSMTQHPIAYVLLIVSGICTGVISFDGFHHQTFETSRLWFAGTCLLLALRIFMDARFVRTEMRRQASIENSLAKSRADFPNSPRIPAYIARPDRDPAMSKLDAFDDVPPSDAQKAHALPPVPAEDKPAINALGWFALRWIIAGSAAAAIYMRAGHSGRVLARSFGLFTVILVVYEAGRLLFVIRRDIAIEEVGIFLGGALLRIPLRRFTLRINFLPIGGYTKFSETAQPPLRAYFNLPAWERFAVKLVPLLAMLAIGLVFLGPFHTIETAKTIFTIGIRDARAPATAGARAVRTFFDLVLTHPFWAMGKMAIFFLALNAIELWPGASEVSRSPDARRRISPLLRLSFWLRRLVFMVVLSFDLSWWIAIGYAAFSQ